MDVEKNKNGTSGKSVGLPLVLNATTEKLKTKFTSLADFRLFVLGAAVQKRNGRSIHGSVDISAIPVSKCCH